MNAELEVKTRRLTEMLDASGLDAVLLNAQHNFAWMTGGGTNGVDRSRENGVATLLVNRDGRRYILANNIEIRRMLSEEMPHDGFEPVEYSWQDEKANGNLIVEKAAAVLGKGAVIASDILLNLALPVIESKIAAYRYRLTTDEVERYRTLGADAGNAIKRATGRIAPGQTEAEIAEVLRHELGVDGIESVVTLVAADERISVYRHPVPSSKRWEKLVLLVTCAKRKGLIASLSRIVCFGAVPSELKEKTEAAAYVNACLMNATRPGVTGSELYRVAAEAYAESGFAGEIDLHHQGGAAGYKTRDWVAHPASAEVVQPDQAFAWNPSITGTKVEETFITSASGVEILTASADFPRVSSTAGGREYFSPGILSI